MEIQKIQEASTIYLGKEIWYQEEVTSTQEVAQGLQEQFQTGTIFLADRQTKGKGTKGRVWYTGNTENIAMTILLKPNCLLTEIEGITIEIAEAIQEAMRKTYGILLEIKEPNDLLLNGKKIAGILTESHTQKGLVKDIRIGIGCNVNGTIFSKETEEIATSFKREFGKEFQREEIIRVWIEKLEEKWKRRNMF